MSMTTALGFPKTEQMKKNREKKMYALHLFNTTKYMSVEKKKRGWSVNKFIINQMQVNLSFDFKSSFQSKSIL